MSTIIGLVSTFRLPLQTIHLLDLGAINLLPEVQSSPKFFSDWTLPQQFCFSRSTTIIHHSILITLSAISMVDGLCAIIIIVFLPFIFLNA